MRLHEFISEQVDGDEEWRSALEETDARRALGRALLEARMRAGMTQTELARRAGTQQAVVSRVERGNTTASIETVRKLAAALGLRPRILLEEVNTPSGRTEEPRRQVIWRKSPSGGITYPWKRFWCPRTGSISLADGGFLVDPEAQWGEIHNPDVVGFENLRNLRCLILLGEPGLGKSTAMADEVELLETDVSRRGNAFVWADLREYQTDTSLCDEIFGREEIQRWIHGRHDLHLILDSLDECLLHVDSVAAVLLRELRKLPVERLWLRIACRTADWPAELEAGLRDLWDKQSIDAYELVPLRRRDVLEAVKRRRLDPDKFVDEVEQKDAVPFAIKPLTLEFLINVYKRSGELPSERSDLYLQGCRLLCDETTSSRRQLAASFSVAERLVVAERIAAVTLLGNRAAVWTEQDFGNVPETDVTLADLEGREEPTDERNFPVNAAALRDALGTGLFSSRGPSRMGWAHLTYAEFLAARYLARANLSLSKIMDFLIHPAPGRKKLIPQLYGVAAWLADLRSDVAQQLMIVQPEVLLRTDPATLDDQRRPNLVQALLEAFEAGELIDDFSLRGMLGRLRHDGLAQQLRPYLRDTTKDLLVRRVVGDIAEACDVSELQQDLLEIALDPNEPNPLRSNCIYALGQVADKETRRKLLPLTRGEVGDDPDDELKGPALLALWPQAITVEEVLSVLSAPKNPDLFGGYRAFLDRHFADRLDLPGLIAVLAWASGKLDDDSIQEDFDRIIDSIMLNAWSHLDDADICRAFAQVAFKRLIHHDELVKRDYDQTFAAEFRARADKRLRVLEELLPLVRKPDETSLWLTWGSTSFVEVADIPWLLRQLTTATTAKDRRILGQLVGRLFTPELHVYFSDVYNAYQRFPELQQPLSWAFNAVQVDSPEADRSRKIWKLSKGKERPLLTPPPSERIRGLLEAVEAGNLDAWWQLNREMTLEAHSTHYNKEFERDLTSFPGWRDADGSTRARIIRAAEVYVLQRDAQKEKWWGRNVFHFPAAAGYRALRLLLTLAPESIDSLESEVWAGWTPIIIAYPSSTGDESDADRQLMALAYEKAPEHLLEGALELIDSEAEQHDYLFTLGRIRHCADDRMNLALLNKLRTSNLKPGATSQLLDFLLEGDLQEAEALALSLLKEGAAGTKEERDLAIAAGASLVGRAGADQWDGLWKILAVDDDLATHVMERVVHSSDWRGGSFASRLADEQIADLFIWLEERFPHSEDIEHTGAHFVSPREQLLRFRDSLLQVLEVRGTFDACAALERVKSAFPELQWVTAVLLRAQEAARRTSWIPPEPKHILEAVGLASRRFVQSGDQLLDVIIESLERLQRKLQGETPAVRDLWDRMPNDYYRPVDENELSDYIKRHLDEDLRQRGVIVNREVELRKGFRKGSGERTDIRVDAVAKSGSPERLDRLSVVIETKGRWHPELMTAMDTQLAKRYLKEHGTTCGLYLVGWFESPQWDPEHTQRGLAEKRSLQDVVVELKKQASYLSVGRVVELSLLNLELR